MAEYFVDLLNVLVAFYASYVVVVYPMWRTLGWKRRSTLLYIGCLTLYLSIGLVIASRVFTMDVLASQFFKLLIAIPPLLVAVWLFRKQIWQIVFLIGLGFLYATIATGVGTYASETWFAAASYPLLYASFISIAIAAFTLPPLLFLLRRLFANPSMKQAVPFWRIVWILPVSLFGITMMSSSFFHDGPKDGTFLIFRAFIYAALLATCYLVEASVRQVRAAEDARRKAEEHATKSAFYHKMAHDLLTPLTIISTNVQVAENHPDEAAALMKESQTEIMRIAQIINQALEAGGGESE